MAKWTVGADVASLTMLTCLCYNLRKADRVVTRLYDETLRPSGLVATQLQVLMAVRRFEPIMMSALAEELAMDRTTVTRNLKPLQRKGLLQLRTGTNRRIREVSLTKKGTSVLARARALWSKVQRRVVTSLGEHEVPQLVSALGAIVDTVGTLPTRSKRG